MVFAVNIGSVFSDMLWTSMGSEVKFSPFSFANQKLPTKFFRLSSHPGAASIRSGTEGSFFFKTETSVVRTSARRYI
jgi:hypothetical protein